MKKLKLIDVYVIILTLAAISSVILRSLALINDFDILTMQFSNSICATVGNWIVILSTLSFGAYLFLNKDKTDLIEKTDNAASFIPAGIVSTALLFMGVHLIKEMNNHHTPLLRPLLIFAALLALLSVGAFFLSIFIEQKNSMVKASFSISIVIFLALYSCYLYFNREVHPTNSPNKVVDQMAYLFSAAFFLYESRIAIGRAKWRGYVAFGFMASLCCIYSSLPALVYYSLERYSIADSLFESVLTLALAIYITSKVLQTKRLTPDAECETARTIAALAEMRQEEIDTLRKNSHARDNNNMVENDDNSTDAQNYTFDIPYVETRSEFSDDIPLE
jgi:hypothetical protein